MYYISIHQSRLPTASNYLDLIVYLIITSWRYIIKYKTPLKSLRKSTGEYKDILKYKKSNGSLWSKAYKILKSNKNFGITINTKTAF